MSRRRCLAEGCETKVFADSKFGLCLQHHTQVMDYRREHSPSRRMSRTRQGGRKRGIEWCISLADYDRLTKQPCVYCGWFNVGCLWAGLDRIDWLGDYTIDNVLPACTNCNQARGTLPVADFLELAHRVAERYPREGPARAPSSLTLEAQLLHDNPILPRGRPKGSTKISIRERVELARQRGVQAKRAAEKHRTGETYPGHGEPEPTRHVPPEKESAPVAPSRDPYAGLIERALHLPPNSTFALRARRMQAAAQLPARVRVVLEQRARADYSTPGVPFAEFEAAWIAERLLSGAQVFACLHCLDGAVTAAITGAVACAVCRTKKAP